MIRIASFNVENLFARPKVFDLPDWNAGEPVLKAYEEVSVLLQKTSYSAGDKIRIRDLLVTLEIYTVDKKRRQFAATTPQILSGRGLEKIAVRLIASRAISAKMWRSLPRDAVIGSGGLSWPKRQSMKPPRA
jgi:hypothetical protein